MIKILSLVLTIGGMIALILGVLGIFGNNVVSLSPWALTILGVVFFLSCVSMLKYRKDKPAE
ncbi:membrane protein [Sediminibacter sp. Hel_I_10]|uniref:membrane protein n=1 Tax=Sediminibacter sp. Hel_I_10 TaxID=1392490 RepID=UPI00047ECF56|nr:membrane protein [Sediminibacter sp. Hel_I_10]